MLFKRSIETPGKVTVRRIAAVKRIPLSSQNLFPYITPRQAQDSRVHHKQNSKF